MNKNLKVFVPLLVLSIAAVSQVNSTVGKRLKEQHPAVEWNVTSATTVDIDCDGKPDTFVWGVDDKVTRSFFIKGKTERHTRPEVVLGFERASAAKTQTENIPFRKDTGYYGFCSLPNSIEVKPLSCEWEDGQLPGCKTNQRCEALWVRDGQCGEFFVYWDSSRQKATWVRH